MNDLGESSGADAFEPVLCSNPRIGRTLMMLSREEFTGVSPVGQRAGEPEYPLFWEPRESVIAAMVGALRPFKGGDVLQIRTGTGYETAVLANMFDSVVGIESNIARVEGAREHFRMLGIGNVSFRIRDWREGFEIEEPVDAVYVSELLRGLPEKLLEGLAVGGRLVVPIRRSRRLANVVRIERRASDGFRKDVLGEVDYRLRLGDLLIDFGLLSRPVVERAADRAEERGVRLGELLVAEGVVDQETVFHTLSLLHGVPFGSVQSLLHGATTELFEELPDRYMRHTGAVPVKKVDDTVVIASTEIHPPTGEFREALDAKAADTYLVTPRAYQRIWEALETDRIAEESLQSARESNDESRPEIGSKHEVQNEYARLFDSILYDALAERASDVHFERYGPRDIRIRFRIDGELEEMKRYALSPEDYRGLINVIKIAGELDIAERRLPQGGRVTREIDEQEVDLRIQTQPTMEHEFCVVRLLPQDQNLLSIAELGFPDEIAREYRRLIHNPNGLVLVVGPTGSGKTTTLYAGIRELADDASKKIITAEDPVEYTIDGIEQTPIRPKIGFDFPDAVRSFVRQDPDIILVGEIRDKETALEAIRASQTGHLVLSTLHCNDSADAIQRLFDLGMHPNSVASELVGVFAQRLAKRICTECRHEVPPDEEIVDELFPDGPPTDFQAFRGTGCRRCDGQGTRGRIAVVESLPVGPRLRRGISRQLPLDDLRQEAVEAGLTRMRQHGLQLVREGTIPLEELPRILSVEALRPTPSDVSD